MGLEVTVIEMLSFAMPPRVDRDMAKFVEESLRKRIDYYLTKR